MPLDGLSLRYLAQELHTVLVDGRIDRINHPSKHDLYFQIRSGGTTHKLVLSINASSARAHLTEENPANPLRASGFCMYLRKHFGGGRIQKIYTEGDERILMIDVSKRNELGDLEIKSIYAELMGRHSNIIVLNQDKKILEALKHIDHEQNRVREILPGRPYLPPPFQEKQQVEDLIRIANVGGAILQNEDHRNNYTQVNRLVMDKLMGVSPLLAKELCFRADLNPMEQAARLKSSDLQKLDHVLFQFARNVTDGEAKPGILAADPFGHELLDFHAYEITSAPYFIQYPDLSAAMETFYAQSQSRKGLQEKRQALMRKVQADYEAVRKLIAIRKKDIESANKRNQDREAGELILGNLHLAKDRATELTGIDYYDPDLREKTVALDPRYSAADNAARYFKRYERAGSRLEEASKRLIKEESDRLWLESLMSQLELADSRDEIDELEEEYLETFRGRKKSARIKKKEKPTKKSMPRSFTSSDGYQILVGRNSRQNDYLAHKLAAPDDLWLHRHLAAGTHVIVRHRSDEIPDTTLSEAAGLCAWFSQTAGSASNPGDRGERMEIAYCSARDVKRMPGGKPGLVIYENFKTILSDPLNPIHLTGDLEERIDPDSSLS